MKDMGVLETMGRMELDAVVREIRDRYRPGALDALSAADPAWRVAVDRREREVGALYEALRDADATLVRWRRALAELARLWARVGSEVEVEPVTPSLEQVA